jgi:hypothetical protein
MEVKFQNKLSDLEEYYKYRLLQTDEGKRFGNQAFEFRLSRLTFLVIILALIYWKVSDNGLVAFLFGFVIIALIDLGIFVATKFKPYYYFGRKVYKQEEQAMSQRDVQHFQLPRTIKIDDDWLEVSSSELVHRWKWKMVDSVGVTSDFIFLHAGKCCFFAIPKRDFPSEQSFVEFGKKLVELEKMYKGQPVGEG